MTPYTADHSDIHSGSIVRTAPEPGRPDKVMDIGRVIIGNTVQPSLISWLTTRSRGSAYQSWASPREILVLTHEVAQVVLAQLDRERHPNTAYLWAVSFATEVWLDRLADGATLGAADLARFVEIAHTDTTIGYEKLIRTQLLLAREKASRIEYQRLEENYQACLKRMKSGAGHAQH